MSSSFLKKACEIEWNYLSSVAFAASIVTTTGSRSKIPQTKSGKGFYLFFLLAGLPAFALLLSRVAKNTENAVECLAHFMNKKHYRVTRTTMIVFYFIGGVIVLTIIPCIAIISTTDLTLSDSAIYVTKAILGTVESEQSDKSVTTCEGEILNTDTCLASLLLPIQPDDRLDYGLSTECQMNVETGCIASYTATKMVYIIWTILGVVWLLTFLYLAILSSDYEDERARSTLLSSTNTSYTNASKTTSRKPSEQTLQVSRKQSVSTAVVC